VFAAAFVMCVSALDTYQLFFWFEKCKT